MSPTSCSVCLCTGGFRFPHHTFCVLNIEPGLASIPISMSQISYLMSTEQRVQKQLSTLKLWTNVILQSETRTVGARRTTGGGLNYDCSMTSLKALLQPQLIILLAA